MRATEPWLERRPRPGETCVFSQSPALWRRDALMFDRVYAPLERAERSFDRTEPPDIPIDFSFGSRAIDKEIDYKQGVTGHWLEYVGIPEGADYQEMEQSYAIQSEQETELQYRMSGIMGTWCAADTGLFFKRFGQGEEQAYQGALNNLPLVDPAVGWDEVRAFRQDPEAVRKYRDLRLWLADGLHASSPQHATDLIAQRIDDYRWAIRKHGLETKAGTLSNLWDWKQSLPLMAAVGTAATLGSAVVAALVAGVAITSGVGAYFAHRKISEIDTRRGASREVAILVDIQDRFGKSAVH